MERGLEEASVRVRNERQVKLVDTEKRGFVILDQVRIIFQLKSGDVKKLSQHVPIKNITEVQLIVKVKT